MDTMNYTLLSVLGEGGYGHVWLAKDMSDGKPVAIKEAIRSQYENNHVALENEKAVLEHIGHLEGVPRLLGTVELNGQMSLVIEYIEGQPMMDVPKSSLPLATVVGYITEFFGIVARLHGRGVRHRDLHNKNILQGKDGHIHVIDFGVSKIVDPTQPELFKHEVGEVASKVRTWLTDLVQRPSDPCCLTLDAWLQEAMMHIWQEEWEPTATFLLAQWQEQLRQLAIQESSLSSVVIVPQA